MNRKSVFIMGLAAFFILFFLIYGKWFSKPENLGQDVNQNGLWDDVEAVLLEQYAQAPNTQKAALQKARALQTGIVDPSRARASADSSDRALSCLESFLGLEAAIEVGQFVEAQLTTTRARSDAYAKYNVALSGQVFTSQEASSKNCEFEVATEEK